MSQSSCIGAIITERNSEFESLTVLIDKRAVVGSQIVGLNNEIDGFGLIEPVWMKRD